MPIATGTIILTMVLPLTTVLDKLDWSDDKAGAMAIIKYLKTL